MVEGLSSSARCTSPWWRATNTASSRHSLGTRSRWQMPSSSSTPRASCPMWLGHSSGGVVPLPRSCVSAAKRTASGKPLDSGVVEHQQDVQPGVHFGMMRRRLRHAEQGVDLGQDACQRAASPQRLDHQRRPRLHQAARKLLPYALGHESVRPRRLRTIARISSSVSGAISKAEARREARHAQDAHRILGESRAHVPQDAALAGPARRHADR